VPFRCALLLVHTADWVLGMARLCITPLNERTGDFVSGIFLSGNHLLVLNDILDVSKVRSRQNKVGI
jgi:hypothetical protein